MKEIIDFLGSLYTLTEIKIIAIAGVLGGILAKALGGFDQQITALFALVIVDYATGMFAAWKHNKIWSKTGYHGLMKKLSIFGAVAFAVLVDCALKTDVIRYTAIAGFGIMEAISIIENADRGGRAEQYAAHQLHGYQSGDFSGNNHIRNTNYYGRGDLICQQYKAKLQAQVIYR